MPLTTLHHHGGHQNNKFGVHYWADDATVSLAALGGLLLIWGALSTKPTAAPASMQHYFNGHKVLLKNGDFDDQNHHCW